MANMMTRLYSNFAGCDFTNDPAKVALNRSPNCINMYKNYSDTQGNCIQTRCGFRSLFNFSFQENNEIVYPRINGMFLFQVDNMKKLVVHVGNYLVLWDYPAGATYKIIYNRMNDVKSSFVIFNDKLYINDGLNYLVYDGEYVKNVSEEAFIPTTTISRKPKGGGALYQDVNVLTGRRKNSFVADGVSTEYELDVKLIDDEPVKVIVNKIEIDSSKFSVNRVEGIITFNTAPESPNTEGQDNVIIEFTKYGTDYDIRIPNCIKNIVFDNRIFFTGNPQFKNAIFHCELNNPAYISDLAYYQDGTSDSAIKSFTVGNNLLWVFKEPSQQNDTIFYHSPVIDSEYGKVYPSKQGNISVGCISECINFNDDIVFVSPLGLEGMIGDIEQEQLISHRSSLIDGKFINENNFEELQMCEWKGYLICLVDGKYYLADSRQKYQGINGYEYEWYFWKHTSEEFINYFGKPVYIMSINEELLMGTDSGYIFVLDESSNKDYNFNIYSCWQTPYDTFGDTNNLKTTNKRGGVAKIKTIPNGKVKVSVQTNRKPEKFIKEYSATGFDFNNIDFDNFAFTLKDMSYIVYKIKMKKFIDLTLKFFSEDKPFGLYDITLEVYQGSYIKRT